MVLTSSLGRNTKISAHQLIIWMSLTSKGMIFRYVGDVIVDVSVAWGGVEVETVQRPFAERREIGKREYLVLASLPITPFILRLLGPIFSLLLCLPLADWHPGWVPITAPRQWGGARGPPSA